MLGHLLAFARRKRRYQPIRTTQFQRHRNCAKLRADSGRSVGRMIEQHRCLQVEWFLQPQSGFRLGRYPLPMESSSFAPRNDVLENSQMNHDSYADNYIRAILNGVKSIAMVGASPVNVRPSYFAFKYLAQRGYDMIPVNPGHVGKSLLGKPFVASLSDIGRPIDMIDIFRNSSHIMPVVEEALKLTPLPKVIWMQLGARDDLAAAKAEAAGLKVVMNRCPKIEYGRLSSEISWMGVNSRTLSSKRAPIPTQGMLLSLNRMSVSVGGNNSAHRASKNKSDPS